MVSISCFKVAQASITFCYHTVLVYSHLIAYSLFLLVINVITLLACTTFFFFVQSESAVVSVLLCVPESIVGLHES